MCHIGSLYDVRVFCTILVCLLWFFFMSREESCTTQVIYHFEGYDTTFLFLPFFRGKAPSQFKKGALKVTYNNNVQSFMSLTTTFNCTQKVKTLRQVHACCRKFIQLSKTVSFFFIQWFFTKLWRKTSRMYQS